MAETRVYVFLVRRIICVVKGQRILTTSNSVASGLAHSKLIIWADQMLIRRAIFRDIYTYPSFVSYTREVVENVITSTPNYGLLTMPQQDRNTCLCLLSLTLNLLLRKSNWTFLPITGHLSSSSLKGEGCRGGWVDSSCPGSEFPVYRPLFRIPHHPGELP